MGAALMLSLLCGETKNYFVRRPSDRLRGTFSLCGGEVFRRTAAGEDEVPDRLRDGQYFRVTGSAFNDGVWQYPAVTLTDEVFEGEIWLMSPPADALALADEIAAWVEKYGENASSPYASESFGGYSYTMRGTGWRTSAGSAGSAEPISWKTAFRTRLNRYRRLME